MKILWSCMVGLALASSCLAQAELPSAPAPQTPASTSAPDKQKEKEIEKKEQSQRVLGVLPQFAVTDRQDAPPLSPGSKFHLFYKSAFDPVTLGILGVQAGFSQAENEFPDYGQGAAGYGKRYGAALADSTSSGFFSNFFYPVLFKHDPRYFRLGSGSFRHRLGYSVTQEFVAHRDRGGKTFNFSNVLGAFTSGGISNAYYPRSDRGFELTMSRSVIALGYGMAGGLFDEFWPDIHHKLFHKKPAPQPEQK
ncbi:MAG: hypothetical protein JST79_05040 [Acidobacteria bacterium]|nr:hypothetical protein [Acidobacteriota bacterium]